MSYAAVAAGGISLLGGLMGSSSQKKAAQAQAQAAQQAAAQQLQAARESNALQADIYKSNLGLLAPGLQGNQTALAALMSGMGLGGLRSSRTGPVTGQTGNLTTAGGQVVNAQGQPVIDYGIDSSGVGATQQELDAASSPWAGFFTEQFAPNDLTLDPSYQFRLDQGQRALQARQAAGGNRFGSQAMRDIVDYGQNSASQEYASAFDRFQRNKQTAFDRLTGIMGGTSGATGATAQAGQTAASNIGQNLIGAAGKAGEYGVGAANAIGAGTVGATNALVSGVNSGVNNWYRFRDLTPSNPTGGYTGVSAPLPLVSDYSVGGGAPVKFGP